MSDSRKIILVTGGSGFLGQHLVPKLLEKYDTACIRVLSRDGNAIQKLLTRCPDERLIPIVGRIEDKSTTAYAAGGADTIVHLAALKHIDLCERYPQEAVETNINGTRILLDAFAGDTFVAMSTDKASEATNCYGATKLIIEKLVLEQAGRQLGRRYMIVRSGNLFGSTGSVIEKWRQQIKQRNSIDITSPSMTRFFIDAATVADFIVELMRHGQTKSVNIPHQKALRLTDLAEAAIDLWGDRGTTLKVVGPRAGEKEHESLYSEGECVETSGTSRLSCDAQTWTSGEIRHKLRSLDENA